MTERIARLGQIAGEEIRLAEAEHHIPEGEERVVPQLPQQVVVSTNDDPDAVSKPLTLDNLVALLVERHGSNALQVARQRAKMYARQENARSARVWLRAADLLTRMKLKAKMSIP